MPSSNRPLRVQCMTVFFILNFGWIVTVQIWSCNGLEKSLDLTALNKHGKVYEDGSEAFILAMLHSLQWVLQCH